MSRPSRRSRGSVTIEDVARIAGVSAMTVSRVINGEKNVRDTTRAAVLEAIDQLSYSPNMAARSLAAGQATHIGLLYANPSAAYLSQFLVGALEGRKTGGLPPGHRGLRIGRRRRAGRGDAPIPRPPTSRASSCRRRCRNRMPILTELEIAQIPVVTVAMGRPRENALNVRIDDFAAAEEMTESSARARPPPHRPDQGPSQPYRQHRARPRLPVGAGTARHRSRRTRRSSRAISPFARAWSRRAAAGAHRAADRHLRQQRRHGRGRGQRRPSPGPGRPAGHQHRRLRRHRAGDDGLAGADHGPATDCSDGGSGAGAAARGRSRAPLGHRRPAPPSGCSSTA